MNREIPNRFDAAGIWIASATNATVDFPALRFENAPPGANNDRHTELAPE